MRIKQHTEPTDRYQVQRDNYSHRYARNRQNNLRFYTPKIFGLNTNNQQRLRLHNWALALKPGVIRSVILKVKSVATVRERPAVAKILDPPPQITLIDSLLANSV